jgi:hypothetical protein
MPRYPIFIPSKGRALKQHTAKMLTKDGIDFKIVVEPQEVAAYSEKWGEHLLVLPENNRGLVYSRNWIFEYSVAAGDVRHWQFDDDVMWLIRLNKGRRFYCAANIALAAAEDFVERYENVALASFNSEFFLACLADGSSRTHWPPFYRNARCYTNFLVLNSLPNRFRYPSNEDTDMTLQVLADGWCTILFNAFLMKTPATLTAKGGQMTETYAGDGRLKMSRALERMWPGVVETRRRFGRPQHYVKDHWQLFDTPLKPRPDFVMPDKPNEYGMTLKAVGPIKNPELQKVLEEMQPKPEPEDGE